MSYTSDYLKLREERFKQEAEEERKKKEAEEKRKKEENERRLRELFDRDEDIAPVAPASDSEKAAMAQSLHNSFTASKGPLFSFDSTAPNRYDPNWESKYKKQEGEDKVFTDGGDNMFGNVAATGFDTGLSILQGVGNFAEGVTDAILYGVSGVSDLVGADSVADFAKKEAQVNAVDDLFDKIRQKSGTYEYSYLGNKARNAGQGVGQVAGMVGMGEAAAAAGLSRAGISAVTKGVLGASSFGGGMSEAYQLGANDGQAVQLGVANAANEVISEMVFGGLGKGLNVLGFGKGLSSADDLLAKKLSNAAAKFIKSETGQRLLGNALEYTVKSGAEGLEEIISGFGSAMAKDFILFNGKNEKKFREILKDENLLEQFFIGTFASFVAQGGDFVDSVKNKTDFVTGLTKNEQTVVDKEVEKRIAEQEKDGKKLTNEEKDKIYDDVLSDLDKGYISTDTIEETLGGDTYKSYKDTAESEDALKKELDELRQMKSGDRNDIQNDRLAELKAMNLDDTTKRDGLKKQLGEEVFGLVKDSRLVESYNERGRRSQAFQADTSKYDAKQRKVIQNAIDSGILNNTNRTHEFVDMVAKISADKGVSFDFTNNERLKESGFAIGGVTRNGFVTKDGVTINIQSTKALDSVVGHEITHVLEGTKLYDALQQAAFDYAKSKGEYDSRLASVTELYKKYDPDADPMAELTADLVGDYLFTDGDFIKNLSTKHRNVFQKIYDEIKYLCKVATAGSKEARELERVKKLFAEAYRESGKVEGKSNTTYNLSLDNAPKTVYNDNRGDGYARTDEFRNLQAESQRMPDEEIQQYHAGREIDPEIRGRLSRAFELELQSAGSERNYSVRPLLNPKTGKQVNIVENVDGALFHDVFQIARKYLENGELVDLHAVETTEDGIGYDDCDNYLSEDGLSGFSITPDGDLISVFNLSDERGFLKTIASVVREKAKTLDCYASPNQNLMAMYEKIFGFKTASIMDYNMEYDHDNIAENHNMPKVAFMVNTDGDVETRSFTKDQYDEAVAYRNGFVDQASSKEGVSFTSEADDAGDIGPVKYSLSEDIDTFDNSLYNEIELSAVERDRVQSEALTWHVANKGQPFSMPLSNGFTYLCSLDNDGIVHIYGKEESVNIHEFGGNYDNRNTERPDRYVEKFGNQQGIDTGDNVLVENGRDQIAPFAGNVATIQGKGRSHRAGYSKNDTYAHRNPKGWHFNDDGSVEVTYSDGTKETENAAPIKKTSSNDDVFFDASHDEKFSLSANGETPKRYGRYNVYGKDVMLEQDVAPIGASVSNIEQEERGASSATTDKEYVGMDDFLNRDSSVWRNVDYNDDATKASIMKNTHEDMIKDGAIVVVADDVINSVKQSYPDLRGVKKNERTLRLREAMKTLKSNIRQFLSGLKDQSFDFEVNGKVLEARLYNTGINEVLEKVTQEKANMLYTSEEIFKNARYLYSTPDYGGDPNVYRWNYFYTPVQIGQETVGVRIAIRDTATPRESQIYNWGIKKDASLDGVGRGINNRISHDVSSDASDNSIADFAPFVKPDEDTISDDFAPTTQNIAHAENFQKRIESWDGITEGFAFVVGDTPSYLSKLEVMGKKVGNKQVRIDATKIKNIMKDHPEMTKDVIKNLPDLLNDPILVLDSKTVPGRLVLLGEVYANGKPVMMALELNPTTRSGKSTYVNVIKVASAYARQNVQNMISTSTIRYINKNKSRVGDWLKVNRLQLPLPNSQSNSANVSISETMPNVNSNSEKSSDIAPVAKTKVSAEAPTAKPQKSVGAAPYGFDPITQLQFEYGTIPEGENPVRDDSMPKSTNGKDKVSLTARTVKGAEVTPDELVDLLDKETVGGRFSYIPIKNSDTVRKAYDEIAKKGWEVARGEWEARVRRGEVSAELTATGELLLNNAAKAGDRETWLNVLSNYQLMGTNAGQAIQAMRILKTLNPDDSLYMIERSVEQMVKDMNLGTEIVIDEKLKRAYLEAETDTERNVARKKLAKDIAKQIPSTAKEKWTALRYLNMLGNVRTQGKNILGNVGMAVTSRIKNTVAASIEAIAEKVSGGKFHKTKSLFVSKDLLKSARNDFANVEHIALNGGKFNDSMASSTQFQQEIQDARKIFSGVFAPVEWYRRGTNLAMNTGDLIFSKAAYGRALAGYLKANGIKETDFSKIDPKTLDEARAYAVKEAQESTFRDNNWLSNWVSKVGRRKDTPKIGKLLSEGIMPFRKTPANILLRAEEYSPLGIVNATVKSIQAVKGAENVTGADVVNSWAKTLTGTGLFALGMWLNNSGALSGGPDEDDDKEWFEDQYGWQNYSIQIGDHNLTIDFLSPSAMSLLMGAQLNELRQNGDIELKDLESALLSLADPMIEMSMLQGVNDTLDNIRYAENNMGQFLVNACVSYLTQGLTNSLLGQIERSLEKQRMTTYVDKNSDTPAWLQKALGKASAKTPGWDYQQIPYVDAWGEMEDIAPIPALVENMLSPSYISEGISDEVYEELNRLNDAQSDINVYPQTPDKTVTFDDAYGNRHENYNLSADEYVELAQLQGQTQKKLVEEILSNNQYSELTDQEKAKAVQLAYQYAREYGRQEVLGANGFSAKWMAEADDDIVNAIIAHTNEERTFAYDYPEKYKFFNDNGISYSTFKSADEDGKRAYNWAYENPGKFTMSKVISDDFLEYYNLKSTLGDFDAKDENGETVSGLKKERVTEYINNLDLDYGQKIILYRSMYDSKADKMEYNAVILNYLNSRYDISYEERVTILEELDMTVDSNGKVYW